MLKKIVPIIALMAFVAGPLAGVAIFAVANNSAVAKCKEIAAAKEKALCLASADAKRADHMEIGTDSP